MFSDGRNSRSSITRRGTGITVHDTGEVNLVMVVGFITVCVHVHGGGYLGEGICSVTAPHIIRTHINTHTHTTQTWLSNRVKRQKENNDPKVVRRRAVAAERNRLLVEAWGFDPNSMTKSEIIRQLLDPTCGGCTVKSRKNPSGDIKHTFTKSVLTRILHSKMRVPAPYKDVESFLEYVESASQLVGNQTVLHMSTTVVKMDTTRAPQSSGVTTAIVSTNNPSKCTQCYLSFTNIPT